MFIEPSFLFLCVLEILSDKGIILGGCEWPERIRFSLPNCALPPCLVDFMVKVLFPFLCTDHLQQSSKMLGKALNVIMSLSSAGKFSLSHQN